jgi:hypothetical protein
MMRHMKATAMAMVLAALLWCPALQDEGTHMLVLIVGAVECIGVGAAGTAEAEAYFTKITIENIQYTSRYAL